MPFSAVLKQPEEFRLGPVTIYGNTTHQADRTFYVNLTNAIGALIAGCGS